MFRTMKSKAIVALSLLLLVGCATPARRIAKNPAMFAAFPPEIQEKVRKGVAEVGYTKDMVFIAFGRPDRIVQRTTAEGPTEIWVYTDVAQSTGYVPMEASYLHRSKRHGFYPGYDTYWVGVHQQQEFEIQRVEFRDGKAVAIETQQ